MRLLLTVISLTLVIFTVASGCSRAPSPSSGSAPSIGRGVPAPAPLPPVGAPQQPQADKAQASLISQEPAFGRMVARTTTLGITVQSVAEAIDQVKTLAESLGGYVVSSTWSGRESEGRAVVSVRVPAEKYDDTMKKLRVLAVEVVSENTETRDVTEEYVDLQSRLRNLEATEKEYLTLLQRANTVEDVLKIQQQLSNVRGDIEKNKGRMQYLERTSSTSLIQVNLERVRQFKADFAASLIQVEEGEEVAFSNRTSGGEAPFGYLWDFGDTATSTERQPAHSYSNGGNYSVSLKVTDAKGNTSIEAKSNYIKVLSAPGWTPLNTVRSAWYGLSAVGRGLGNLAIWVAMFSPIWIPGGLAFWGIRKWRKKARLNKKN